MIRQREFLMKNRRRIALVALLAAFILALSAEHSGLGHADSAHDAAADLVSMCLAVIGAGVALAVAAAVAEAHFRRRDSRTSRFRPAVDRRTSCHPGPYARAGPRVLQVFRL